jgi:hypothetical protein
MDAKYKEYTLRKIDSIWRGRGREAWNFGKVGRLTALQNSAQGLNHGKVRRDTLLIVGKPSRRASGRRLSAGG